MTLIKAENCSLSFSLYNYKKISYKRIDLFISFN